MSAIPGSPESASPDGDDPLRQIFSLFVSVSVRLGLVITSIEGTAVKLLSGSDERSIDLVNIVRHLMGCERSSWEEVLERFLRGVATSHPRETAGLLGRPFDEIRGFLRPCLQPPSDRMWSDELAPGVHLALAVDTPEHILYVPEHAIADSGHSVEEWLAEAGRNLLAHTPADWFEVIDQGEYELRQACVGDCYDAARALVLDQLLPAEAGHGWIVAPVGRDEMVFVPNRYEGGDRIIGELAALAAPRFAQVPYAITPRVYTVKGGRWATKPMIIGPGNRPIFVELDTTGPTKFIKFDEIGAAEEPGGPPSTE